MTHTTTYPIGIAGQPWQAQHKAAWLTQQQIKRSYHDDVVKRILRLQDRFDVQQYGQLDYQGRQYPLYVVQSHGWQGDKPTILVTGGVHGYETSGVHGALSFLESQAQEYQVQANILVAPCISPWGYETINRWNPYAIDPNRSFVEHSPAEESAALMRYLASRQLTLSVHIDLHETTDTDNSEFRPALAARDGVTHANWDIPDGFYLVGDTEHPVPEFQQAVIDAVRPVTHIAPADEQGRLIGEPITQAGVVNYATKALGLCIGFSNARYATTTEVYPDSPTASPQQCIDAQVAAVVGALDYVLQHGA